MRTPAPVDIDLIGSSPTPCEYRLMHIESGLFIRGDNDPTIPNMVDDWRRANYFSSGNHHIFNEESTLEFQWAWMRDECGLSWMESADMNAYRVHVLVGDSGY
jgi:hypothetical protein